MHFILTMKGTFVSSPTEGFFSTDYTSPQREGSVHGLMEWRVLVLLCEESLCKVLWELEQLVEIDKGHRNSGGGLFSSGLSFCFKGTLI